MFAVFAACAILGAALLVAQLALPSSAGHGASLFGARARVLGIACFGAGGAAAARAGWRPGLVAFCAVTAGMVAMIATAWVMSRSRGPAPTNRGGRGGRGAMP